MIYLASYKSIRPGVYGITNRLIRYGTRSIYSHSELCIGNPFESQVLCVSASGVDGGVRGKVMQLNPDSWDILPLPWVSEQRVLDVLEEEDDCGYDYSGVFRFAVPWVPDLILMPSDSKWFCSELIAYTMLLSEPWRYSPAELHSIALAAQQWRG